MSSEPDGASEAAASSAPRSRPALGSRRPSAATHSSGPAATHSSHALAAAACGSRRPSAASGPGGAAGAVKSPEDCAGDPWSPSPPEGEGGAAPRGLPPPQPPPPMAPGAAADPARTAVSSAVRAVLEQDLPHLASEADAIAALHSGPPEELFALLADACARRWARERAPPPLRQPPQPVPTHSASPQPGGSGFADEVAPGDEVVLAPGGSGSALPPPYAVLRPGERGVVVEVDGSELPYRVRSSSGASGWFRRGEIARAPLAAAETPPAAPPPAGYGGRVAAPQVVPLERERAARAGWEAAAAALGIPSAAAAAAAQRQWCATGFATPMRSHLSPPRRS
eukprot:TRINITY_DN28577_c0_g1_i4.p1 TRINITY_DN28577_c0_g1~~TRINITY_DN28577_c0_g1_i4.p1  ORF type:complete len:340 (+),score=65.87 TRINITY_DN28577_c0_g1_i4:66-1085(+)